MSSPFSDADRLAIVDAIAGAEKGSRGEVRVHVEDRCPPGGPLSRARSLFAELGMHHTRDDTGVLLYVATVDRRAAVFAGAGIHAVVRKRTWETVVDDVAKGFAAGEGTAGIVRALGRIGEVLRRHAAGADRHGNELPDQMTETR